MTEHSKEPLVADAEYFATLAGDVEDDPGTAENPLPAAACDNCDGAGDTADGVCDACDGSGLARMRDDVFVFPQMMADQLDRHITRLQALVVLARSANALAGSVKGVREGGSNGGKRGTVLLLVAQQAREIARELGRISAKVPRNDLLAEM